MVHISSIPKPLQWHIEPLNWQLQDDILTMTAGANTDLFHDPRGKFVKQNAPSLLFDADNDFLLSTFTTVEFASRADAAVLLIYQDETHWAKLCFERTPQQYHAIVSVVTKGTSDDCNSLFIDTQSTYLRVAKIGSAFAFHQSNNGKTWHLIRVFALDSKHKTKVGFLAQSPTGEACTVTFSDIHYEEKTLTDIHSGE